MPRRPKPRAGEAHEPAQQPAPETLGALIRKFRRRRSQVHNGKPWTLDDLAVATEDDKGHLSRIEHGTTLPSRATLLRIAEALELSRDETEFLLHLGGFALHSGTPDRLDAAVVIGWLARHSGACPVPYTLYSVDGRVWYCNALWLRVAGLTPGQFRCCLAGQVLAETYFDPCVTARNWRTRFVNLEQIKRRTVARIRRAADEGRIPAASIARILADPRMQTYWDELEDAVPYSKLSGEQGYSEFEYPGRGVLRFQTWVCPVQVDPRFLLIMHMPSDFATRDALAAVRRDPRPREGEPCLRHGYAGAAARL